MQSILDWLKAAPLLDRLATVSVGAVLLLVTLLGVAGSFSVVMHVVRLWRKRAEYFASPLGRLRKGTISGLGSVEWEELGKRELVASKQLQDHLENVEQDILRLRDG